MMIANILKRLAKVKKMQKLNQTKFAAHMGWTKGYVTQLKQAGRLVFTDDGKVDVEASELKIKETEDHNRDDVKERHAEARGVDTKVEEIGKAKKATAPVDQNKVTFSSARASEQKFKALHAELDYNERIGKLVSKEDMKAAIGDLVTTFRQNIENMPHRISADLVGKDINEIRLLLKEAIRHELGLLERGCHEKLNHHTESV
jgi:transcriptional regulator with XRE-family HTH domain